MIRLVILIAIAMGSSTALADHHEKMGNDCERPETDVKVPDGATASRDALLDAKDGVTSFVNKGELYVDCMSKHIDELRAEVEAAMADEGDKKSAKQKAAEKEYAELIKAHDAVVGEMQQVASEFNQAIRDYNARSE